MHSYNQFREHQDGNGPVITNVHQYFFMNWIFIFLNKKKKQIFFRDHSTMESLARVQQMANACFLLVFIRMTQNAFHNDVNYAGMNLIDSAEGITTSRGNSGSSPKEALPPPFNVRNELDPSTCMVAPGRSRRGNTFHTFDTRPHQLDFRTRGSGQQKINPSF